MATLVMILILLALMPLRVPVCAVMGLSAVAGLLILDMPVSTLVRYMATDVRSVPLLAIPFFILAGNLMNHFDMTRRIFDFLSALVGYFSGGLAQAAVLTTLVFGGISGSALATIAGIGVITIHAMRKAGYRPEFSAALVVSGSLMDPLIPPSIMFILYAVQMNVSIADLFVAGIVPGVLLGVLLMLNNVVLSKTGIERFPPPERPSFDRLWRSFVAAFPALLTPVVILRSMTTGLVTPTEASVLAVLYTLLLGVLHREITWKRLMAAFDDSVRATALIMFLTALGSVMGFVMTSERTAETVAHWMVSFTDSKYLVLALVVLALLALGVFLEAVPVLLISIPLFGPLVIGYGVDPVHFGVVLTFAILLGIIHPPIGLGIFAVCAITRLPMGPVVRATLLFYPVLLLCLLLITFIPSLSTWLPTVLITK
ncbi:MAG: TRAP transporter large permease [Alphaproteobacteria bacterium]|nr:TRAP transporter large permease [Alphaproteobacteria bacterium]